MRVVWVVLCCLVAGATAELNQPSSCVYLPNAKFVGGNLLRGPVRDLESPSACCDRCLNYRGRERCVAYTFYWNNGRSECWLKRTSAILQVSPFGQAGFPNFFLNETYPDLSSDLGHLFSGMWDLSTTPLRLSLEMVKGSWEFAVTSQGRRLLPFPFRFPGMRIREIRDTCDLEDYKVNWAYVSNSVESLPIYNLKCPADCRKACRKHQEESGRYSCIAFNFKYAVPVTECWLKAGPIGKVFRPGMVSGLSGMDGHKFGDPPIKAAELRDVYRQLLDEGMECIH